MSEPAWNTPEWHRLHPIYFTAEEMKAPIPELLKDVRMELVRLRGKLGDLKSVGWSDRFDAPEHGLTLVIAYLHGVIAEIEKAQKEQEERK